MRCLVVTFVLLAALTAPVRADRSWEAVTEAVGLYEGHAASGGEIVAVETRIEATPEGRLAGSYSYVQGGTTYHGSLSHGRVAGPTTLVFIWHDDWGFGVLTLHFGVNFSSFVGAWGPLDDSAETYPWVGRKLQEDGQSTSGSD